MTTKQKKPRLTKQAQQKIVKSYQPAPAPLTKEAREKAYREIQELFS